MHKGEEIPLVLAGVEYLIPVYKEISRRYPNILDEFIKGNPEILYGNDLQKNGVEIMEPKFLKKVQELAESKYNQFPGQRNGLSSNSLKENHYHKLIMVKSKHYLLLMESSMGPILIQTLIKIDSMKTKASENEDLMRSATLLYQEVEQYMW